MNKEPIVIIVANNKGGVGKTTTAVNIGTVISVLNKEVLLIDLDPQGNASTSLGIEEYKRKVTIYDVLSNAVSISAAIIKTEIPSLDIIPSNIDLAAAEVELLQKPGREYILKEKLRNISKNYDVIIIDCPPSLGLLTINAMAAAKYLLVPMQCEFLALEGLSNLLRTVSMVKDNVNNKLELCGVVLTMYDKRNKLAEYVEKDVRQCLADLVFSTKIPRNVKISEAPSFGKPGIIYAMDSPGSIAYMELAKEILAKIAIYA